MWRKPSSESGVIFPLIVIIVLIVGLVVATQMAQIQQIFKSKAGGANLAITKADEAYTPLPVDASGSGLLVADSPRVGLVINVPPAETPNSGWYRINSMVGVKSANAASPQCSGGQDFYSCTDIKCPDGSTPPGGACYPNDYASTCLSRCPAQPATPTATSPIYSPTPTPRPVPPTGERTCPKGQQSYSCSDVKCADGSVAQGSGCYPNTYLQDCQFNCAAAANELPPTTFSPTPTAIPVTVPTSYPQPSSTNRPVPSPTASPSPSIVPTKVLITDQLYKINGEGPKNSDQTTGVISIPIPEEYYTKPIKLYFNFTDPTPGIKTIFARFYYSDGSMVERQNSVQLISGVQCNEGLYAIQGQLPNNCSSESMYPSLTYTCFDGSVGVIGDGATCVDYAELKRKAFQYCSGKTSCSKPIPYLPNPTVDILLPDPSSRPVPLPLPQAPVNASSSASTSCAAGVQSFQIGRYCGFGRYFGYSASCQDGSGIGTSTTFLSCKTAAEWVSDAQTQCSGRNSCNIRQNNPSNGGGGPGGG